MNLEDQPALTNLQTRHSDTYWTHIGQQHGFLNAILYMYLFVESLCHQENSNALILACFKTEVNSFPKFH